MNIPAYTVSQFSQKTPVHGFTVIELLIVIALVGILGFVAVPGMHNLLQKSKTTAAVNQLAGLVRYARNLAITHNTHVTLCPSQNGESCENLPWHDGVLLFTDQNTNSKVDGADRVERFMQPFVNAGSIRWGSLRNKVQFNGRGMARGTVGSFIYCPENRDPMLAESLVLSFQGRLRLGLDTNGDGIKETGSHRNITCS